MEESHDSSLSAITQRVRDSFWAKVDKSGPVPSHVPEIGNCWVWVSTMRGNGYGSAKLKIGDRLLSMNASRASWVISFGEVPSLHVLHKCDNSLCVRPDHLFLGSQLDNVRDMVKKNRQAKGDNVCLRKYPYIRKHGEKNPMAKLTNDSAREIIRRKALGESNSSLATEYGVSAACINQVGRTSWLRVNS